MQFFSKRGLLESLFYQKSAILRLKSVTSVTLKSCRGLNLGPTLKILGSKISWECLLDDPIGQNAKFFFKRWAFGGGFLSKGVLSCFKKVKWVTFRAHWRLNLGLTPKIWGPKKVRVSIGKNAIFFQMGGFRGSLSKRCHSSFKKVKYITFQANGELNFRPHPKYWLNIVLRVSTF